MFKNGKAWNNHTLVEYDGKGNEVTFCALGALGKAAHGKARGSTKLAANYTEATNIVAQCSPLAKEYGEDVMGGHIPEWNDNLPTKIGFTSIKRVFCKALKVALERERPKVKVRKRAAVKKHAA